MRWLALITVSACLFAAPLPHRQVADQAFAEEREATAEEAPSDQIPGKPPSLTRNMVELQQIYRAVSKQVDHPEKNPDTADKLSKMLVLSIRSKPLLSADAEDDKQRAIYLVLMNRMIALLAQAEIAALTDDQAGLKRSLKKLIEVHNAGHKQAGILPTIF